jgi:hypothetical protein
LFAAGCDLSASNDNSGITAYPDNPDNNKEFLGEWIRMDTGDTWHITSNAIKINNSVSSKTVLLVKQSDRVAEVTEAGRKYYLYASRVANTSFTGKIAGFQELSQSSAQRAASTLWLETIQTLW